MRRVPKGDLSWPGLSRPSTSLIFWNKFVDARDKRGHDHVFQETKVRNSRRVVFRGP
jgi:hypothetical protein